MIPFEEFRIYAENGSIKHKMSDGLTKLVSQQSLDYLSTLTLPRTSDYNKTTKLFWTEDIISISELQRVKDTFGRPTVTNHTFIYKLEDYMTEHKIFQKYPPENLINHLFAGKVM